MYSKIIKKGAKKYKYYYHNIKVNGRVKNVLLGSSRKEALIKLNKLKNKGRVNYYKIKKVNLNNKLSLNKKIKRLVKKVNAFAPKHLKKDNKLVYKVYEKRKKKKPSLNQAETYLTDLINRYKKNYLKISKIKKKNGLAKSETTFTYEPLKYN